MENQITLGILTIIASLATPLINLLLFNKDRHSQINNYSTFLFDFDYLDFKTAKKLTYLFPIPFLILTFLLFDYAKRKFPEMRLIVETAKTNSVPKSKIIEAITSLKLQIFAEQVAKFSEIAFIICILVLLILFFKKTKMKEIDFQDCVLITMIACFVLPILLLIASPTQVDLINITKLNMLEYLYYFTCTLFIITPLFIYVSLYYYFNFIRFQHNVSLTLKDGYVFDDILDICFKTNFITLTVAQNYYFKKYTIPIDNVKYIEKLYVDKPIELQKLKKGKA